MGERKEMSAKKAVKAAKSTDHGTTLVESGTVGCDGGGGSLGHPKVYLKLVHGEITCPYCSRHYKLKPGAKVGGH